MSKSALGLNRELTMDVKYKIHNGASTFAIEQGSRIGCNMAIVYSVGPCSYLKFNSDPITGRYMDEFPIYFDDYPKVAEPRHSADSAWLEPLRNGIHARCKQTLDLGMKPVFHFYEPQMPLIFEQEYPGLVGIWKRETQDGTQDVHTRLDPDNPDTWKLIKSKYREIAAEFPEVALFIVTTGDIAGTYWGIPEAKMDRVDRLVNQAVSAQEGVKEAGSEGQVCFRLWWRNHPVRFYTDAARMIGEATGLPNALDLMNPIMKPYNDPTETLPQLFEKLPPDMPIMYKSTRMDIYDNTPLTLAPGAYPADREQIIEISYEMYHQKLSPWAKVRHIRQGLDAVKDHKLTGYVSLPINMGNNGTDINPESGNLGRMNTWMFEQIAGGDERSDSELVAAWLEREFGEPQSDVATDVLREAEEITNKGLQWGQGITARNSFGSPHSTKLTWFSEGHISEDFPAKMANPDIEFIESMLTMKEEAFVSANENVDRIKAAETSMSADLYAELLDGYTTFRDVIMVTRDWHCYLLMQYAIEKGVFPPERKVLGRMSRYVENFIRNLVRLEDAPAGDYVRSRLSFPDVFPLS